MTFRSRFRAMIDKEAVDPMPHELAGPELAPPTLREQIQNAIRSEISLIAEDRGLESFDEADDFEEDDPEADMLTAYQMVLMTPENDEDLEGAPPERPQDAPDSPPSPDTPAPPSDAPGASEEPGAPPADPIS